jgi:hypothetical protein
MATPEDGRRAQARLVFYEYCVSLVFVTLRRPSRVYRLRQGESGVRRGLPYALVSLLLGWWAVPWGLIYTPLTLWTDLSGGRELTAGEMRAASCPPGPELGG